MEYKKFVMISLDLYQQRIAPSSDPRWFILDSDNLKEKTKLLSTITRSKQSTTTPKNQKVLSTNEAQTDSTELDEEKEDKSFDEQLTESILKEAGGSALARNRNKLFLEKFLVHPKFSLSDSGTIIYKGSDKNHSFRTFLNHLQHISRKSTSFPDITLQVLTRLSPPPHLITNTHLQNYLQNHITKQQFGASLAYSTPAKIEKFDSDEENFQSPKASPTKETTSKAWFGFDR